MEKFFKVRANNNITHATLFKNNYGIYPSVIDPRIYFKVNNIYDGYFDENGKIYIKMDKTSSVEYTTQFTFERDFTFLSEERNKKINSILNENN